MTKLLFYKMVLIMSIMFALSSIKLLMIWGLMELGTLCLLMIMSREMSPRAVESVVKYFMTQSVASVILLAGFLLNYFFSASLNLFSVYSNFAYVYMLIGLFMKIAVFPNPLWFVDVVSGMSLFRGYYILVLSKMLPIYLYYMYSSVGQTYMMVVVGVGSVLFGSILGVKQMSVRKMMTYSSISHMGWIVLCFPVISDISCIVIFILYISMLTPAVFIMNYFSVDSMVKGKKMYKKVWALFLVLVSLLSLGGLPPLVGFFYKWIMFYALILNDNIILSSILMMSGLISLYFYLQISHSLYSIYWPEVKVSTISIYKNKKEWSVYYTNLLFVGKLILMGGLWFLSPLVSMMGL